MARNTPSDGIDGCNGLCSPLHAQAGGVHECSDGPTDDICTSTRRCARLNRSSSSARSAVLAILAAVFLVSPLAQVPVAYAQNQIDESAEGEKLCACNPSIYRFTLDFSEICPPPGIEYGPGTGINQWFCRTDADDDSITDLMPVSVSSYIILELDKGLQVIKQFFRGELDLQDGDTFEYTSITASGDVGVDDIPGAMQMALVSAPDPC